MLSKTLYLLSLIILVLLIYGMLRQESIYWYDVASAFLMNTLLYLKTKIPLMIIAFLLSMKKFVLGLTTLKLLFIGVKRYIIDNIIATNLKAHYFSHVIEPAKQWWQQFDLKQKVLLFIPVSIVTVLGSYATGLSNVLNFIGIKTLIIGFFKSLWLLGSKVIYFFTVYLWSTWLAPVLEIFVFSWILKLLEKIPFIKKYLTWIYEKISAVLIKLGLFLERMIHKPIQKQLTKAGKRTADYLKKSNDKKKLADKNLLKEAPEKQASRVSKNKK